MSRFFKNNGLTIALMLLFAASFVGHWIAGWHFESQELAQHREPAITLLSYAAEPRFLATVFENWESEFLQMAAYVMLTAILFQKGSAESKDPDDPPRDDDLEARGRKADAPAPLRAGAAVRWLYAHSLGLALALLFAASFLLHWRFSALAAAQDARAHGQPALSVAEFLFDAELWFESFQNWQSEFLSTAVLVVLTIFLRHKESPQSKPVAAPNSDTGV